MLLLLAVSSIGHALDKERLWLPVKYQTLYLPLVKAASVAQALERCVTVVEGTLDLEQSKPSHPIYRIQCRQENGRTYNEIVDGVSFAPLTTVTVIEPERVAEEVARQKQIAWQKCQAPLIDRTRLMQELVWQTALEDLVEPQVYSEEEVRFAVNFDARSMGGEPLHYKAECTVRKGSVEIVLRKR
jgi:hypothetical protein